MGDDERIPIEARVAPSPGRPGGGPVDAGAGSPGRGPSFSRVVHEPGRWSRRIIALVAVAALVAGGVALAARGSGPGRADDGAAGGGVRRGRGDEPRDRPAGPGRALPPATAGGNPQAYTARGAFAEAMLRLDRAGSFAYRGKVHAASASLYRPGIWTAPDVTVEGSVLLPQLLTHEVAVDEQGHAVETITAGPTVWSRQASVRSALTGQPWSLQRRVGPNLVGVGAVIKQVGSATNPQAQGPDAVGRRVLRATMPMIPRDPRLGDLLAGSDVELSIDDAGDIARVVAVSGPTDPRLVMSVELTRLGEPQAIRPPDGDIGLRHTVPLVGLRADVTPLDLGQVPAGWTLTAAYVGQSALSSSPCAALNLLYHDPNRVWDGYLWLGVTARPCDQETEGGPRLVPFTAGPFSGQVFEASSFRSGTLVVDAHTAVDFTTDLSSADAATVLASLRPLDAARGPDPVAGLQSA